jgi:hypothetical protein
MFPGQYRAKKPLLLVVVAPFEERWGDKVHTDASGNSDGSNFRENLLHNAICH